MPNVNETVVRYLAAWNERDPKRRRDLVAETWIEEGSYIDAHPRATATPPSMQCLPRRRRNSPATA
jgi:hypothetical protein